MIFKLPKDIEKFNWHVDKVLNKECIVEMKEKRPVRTTQQNRYLHALISLYAIEVGNTLREMKTDLKRGCDFMNYEKNGERYTLGSSDLDTKQMTEWITWIKNHAGMNGFWLPSPEEWSKHWPEFENKINEHKRYL